MTIEELKALGIIVISYGGEETNTEKKEGNNA
jgi:hypothetical protein